MSRKRKPPTCVLSVWETTLKKKAASVKLKDEKQRQRETIGDFLKIL